MHRTLPLSIHRTSMMFTALLLLVLASPALAGTQYFTELLTSKQSLFLPSNVRATYESVSSNPDISDILLGGSVEAGQGLGDGYLSGRGDYLVYTHSFTPLSSYDQILGATLSVSVTDDQFFDGWEKVGLVVEDDFWQKGLATFSLFEGDVTAYFMAGETDLTVSVVSRRGDSIVRASALTWEFESGGPVDTLPGDKGGARPIPEPGAAVLFGMGALVFSRVTRRS